MWNKSGGGDRWWLCWVPLTYLINNYFLDLTLSSAFRIPNMVQFLVTIYGSWSTNGKGPPVHQMWNKSGGGDRWRFCWVPLTYLINNYFLDLILSSAFHIPNMVKFLVTIYGSWSTHGKGPPVHQMWNKTAGRDRWRFCWVPLTLRLGETKMLSFDLDREQKVARTEVEKTFQCNH